MPCQAAKAHALPEVVHVHEVVDPVLVERAQQHLSAELAEGLPAHRLPPGVPALGEGCLDAVGQLVRARALSEPQRVEGPVAGHVAHPGVESLDVPSPLATGPPAGLLYDGAYDVAGVPGTTRPRPMAYPSAGATDQVVPPPPVASPALAHGTQRADDVTYTEGL